jgi:RNA polymerase sigma factor (sigma-70 family)
MRETREQSIERSREMTDEVLSLEAKGGDREARNILYLRLRGLIAKRVYPAKRLLGRASFGQNGPLDADDIDQEAFVIFCVLLDDWQPERTPFVPYMATMMRWHAYRYVRSSLGLRSQRIRLVRFSWLHRIEIGEAISDESPGPAEIAEGTEQWDTLLAQLSDGWRRFVSLKFYEGLSSNQIARASHCSSRTVNRALRAALEVLRQNAQEEWEAL